MDIYRSPPMNVCVYNHRDLFQQMFISIQMNKNRKLVTKAIQEGWGVLVQNTSRH